MVNSIPSSCVNRDNKLLMAKGEIRKEHLPLFLAGKYLIMTNIFIILYLELQEAWTTRNKSQPNKSFSNCKGKRYSRALDFMNLMIVTKNFKPLLTSIKLLLKIIFNEISKLFSYFWIKNIKFGLAV